MVSCRLPGAAEISAGFPPPQIALLIVLKRIQPFSVDCEICGVLVDCVCVWSGCFNGLDLNRQEFLIIVQVNSLRFAIDFLCVRLTRKSQNLFNY